MAKKTCFIVSRCIRHKVKSSVEMKCLFDLVEMITELLLNDWVVYIRDASGIDQIGAPALLSLIELANRPGQEDRLLLYREEAPFLRFFRSKTMRSLKKKYIGDAFDDAYRVIIVGNANDIIIPYSVYGKSICRVTEHFLAGIIEKIYCGTILFCTHESG